jgi:hypothetical protein
MRWCGIVLLVVAGGLAVAREAWGCAACACGDPTLTSMGEETSAAGRLRLALELRHRGEDHQGTITTEQRAALAVTFAPWRPLSLAAIVPFVRRTAEYNDETQRTASLGELELWGRVTLATDRRFAPVHRLQAIAGTKLPTAPRIVDDGVAMRAEAQPGTGSWDGSLGVAWTFRPKNDWSAYASAMVTRVLVEGEVEAPLTTGRASLLVQRAFTEWLAVRAVTDHRVDHDGYVLLAGGDVLVAPATDWVVLLGASAPIAGHETPSFRLAVAVDL